MKNVSLAAVAEAGNRSDLKGYQLSQNSLKSGVEGRFWGGSTLCQEFQVPLLLTSLECMAQDGSPQAHFPISRIDEGKEWEGHSTRMHTILLHPIDQKESQEHT